MRCAHLNNTQRWTLSFPIFMCARCFARTASCECFPICLLWRSWDSQFISVNSFTILNDPFAPPFFDFLLGLPSKARCRKRQFSPYLLPLFVLLFRHTWRCLFYMTDSYSVSIDIGSCSFCQRFVHLLGYMTLIFLFRLLLPSNLVQGWTIAPFVCEVCLYRFRKLLSYVWKHKSFLQNIVQLLVTASNLTPSSQRWLHFLFWLPVTNPSQIISFRTLRFWLLIFWSMCNLTDDFNLK